MEGTMLWFNPARRDGFIFTDEGERLRVDRDGFADGQLLGERCRGTRVTFDRSREQLDAPRAVNVVVVPLVAGAASAIARASLMGKRSPQSVLKRGQAGDAGMDAE